MAGYLMRQGQMPQGWRNGRAALPKTRHSDSESFGRRERHHFGGAKVRTCFHRGGEFYDGRMRQITSMWEALFVVGTSSKLPPVQPISVAHHQKKPNKLAL
jgi:hypothetical protein